MRVFAINLNLQTQIDVIVLAYVLKFPSLESKELRYNLYSAIHFIELTYFWLKHFPLLVHSTISKHLKQRRDGEIDSIINILSMQNYCLKIKTHRTMETTTYRFLLLIVLQSKRLEIPCSIFSYFAIKIFYINLIKESKVMFIIILVKNRLIVEETKNRTIWGDNLLFYYYFSSLR